MTDAERLAKIEAILERMEPNLNRLKETHDRDVADLAALKNKGAGILIGVALTSGAIGAAISRIWASLVGS